MVNQSAPATERFLSRKELDIFLADAFMMVVVAFLPEGEEGEFWESYLELANHGRRTPLHFRHTSQLSLGQGFGLSPVDGGIAIVKPSR